MKYLPVLQELFESDTIIFLLAGIIISVVICLWLKSLKKYIKGVSVSVITYVICEMVSNIHTNFLLEIILLFTGTFALGCGIGFLVCILIGLFCLKSGK